MSFNTAPRGERVHIGLFGQCNSGKSSLLNAITGQDVAIVSEVKGTTTDVVSKPMEIVGIGPCVFLDSAGWDDDSELGKQRFEKTLQALKKTDIAIVVINTYADIVKWQELAKLKSVKTVFVFNKIDVQALDNNLREAVKELFKQELLPLSANTKEGIKTLLEKLIEASQELEERPLLGHLVKAGEVVLLVMPQDLQAPKGRLILPQVQTIRDALDNKCIVVASTTDTMANALASLKDDPDWIICDSSVFKEAYALKPEKTKITSFSILMADYKGDIQAYLAGVNAIAKLTPNSRVLIAECCSHAPVAEDIGRVKIPRQLRKLIGESLTIDVVGGQDFPDDCRQYDCIIQCGACMFNRSFVMERLNKAKVQDVPITNYGILLAYLADILDKIQIN